MTWLFKILGLGKRIPKKFLLLSKSGQRLKASVSPLFFLQEDEKGDKGQ